MERERERGGGEDGRKSEKLLARQRDRETELAIPTKYRSCAVLLH